MKIKSKGIKTSNNKNETNFDPCFGCALPGHIVTNCPIIQRKSNQQKQKAKKEFKRAMVNIWSDSDLSESKDDEE